MNQELNDYKTSLIRKYESKKKDLLIAHRDQKNEQSKILVIEINAIAGLLNEKTINPEDVSYSCEYYPNR
jgi:hypothetical protein